MQRIWFCGILPHSSISFGCEIARARTRGQDNEPLPGNGLGDSEYNACDKGYEGYEFAYRILSVRRIEQPLTLDVLKSTQGMKAPPRGMIYTPLLIVGSVDLEDEDKLRWKLE